MNQTFAFLICILFSFNAYADICVLVDEPTAEQAAQILQNKEKLIDYCSVCPDAEPQTMQIETVKTLSQTFFDEQYYVVTVNGKEIDLAYTYLEKNERYLNLAYLVGCQSSQMKLINRFETELPIKPENTVDFLQKKVEQEAQNIIDECHMAENILTFAPVEVLQKVNGCLITAIKNEINKGFHPNERQKMLNDLNQSTTALFGFYDKLYSANKYCAGGCGSSTQIYPYEEENELLKTMLTKLVFMNQKENRY